MTILKKIKQRASALKWHIALVAICSQLLLIFLLKQSFFPPNAQTTLDILEEGRAQFQKKLSLTQACESFPAHQVFFCWEGFYLQSLLSTPYMPSQIPSQWLGENFSPQSRNAFLVSLGIAYAISNQSILPLQRDLQPTDSVGFQYFVDGWITMKLQQSNAPTSLSTCKFNFSDQSILNTCYWGLGRSLYFLEKGSFPQEIFENSYVKEGFNFAKEFTRPDIRSASEIRSLSTHGETIAALNKLFFTSSTTEKEKELLDSFQKETLECMSKRHIADCINTSRQSSSSQP